MDTVIKTFISSDFLLYSSAMLTNFLFYSTHQRLAAANSSMVIVLMAFSKGLCSHGVLGIERSPINRASSFFNMAHYIENTWLLYMALVLFNSFYSKIKGIKLFPTL
jgi:hypothetical protein